MKKIENCNRVGERFFHPKYGEYEIVKYYNCEKVRVRFVQTGYEYCTSYNHIQASEVFDAFHKGKYNNIKGCAEADSKAYKSWYNMLYRVNNCKGYECASVCDAWLIFANYRDWYNAQYKEEGWHLDKDILSNGSGAYSPETCCFLPSRVNTFFEKHKKAKGYSYNKRRKKFEAYCRNMGKYIHLGMFETAEDARRAYLVFKRNLLKSIMEPYKDKISGRIYKAMEEYLC
jgi:hypothetical protein